MEKGTNRAFETWGQALTALSGKIRPANDADVSLNQIGYWTDNGATYYYHMADSMTYEQTLAAVKGGFRQARHHAGVHAVGQLVLSEGQHRRLDEQWSGHL